MGRRSAFACAAFCILAATCRADGFDVVTWIVRLPPGSNLFVVLLALVAILLADFGLNYLVVGWAARRWSGIDKRTLIGDLIRLTLLGQLADRAGAIAGLFLGGLADEGFPSHRTETSFFVWMIAANFVCTGMLIFALVAWYARGSWKLSWTRTAWLATCAAIFTNPMLPLGLVVWMEST